MTGIEIVLELKKKLGVKTDNALASRLGMALVSIQGWKKRATVTPRQVAGLVHSAGKAATSVSHTSAIRPLVEFYKINKCTSARGAKYELFSVNHDEERVHPYRAGLRAELEKHFGIYVFFDSRGQAIYTGKARKQSLWREMTAAFNRDRGSVQKIKRVRHPENRVEYRTSEEKARQIVEQVVPLYELAAYFSAYHVVDGMVDELESLLVRSFANDLLNIRMERFSRQRKGAK